MTTFFKNTLGLSDKGSKDLFFASISATIVNIFLMATSGILYSFINDSVEASLKGETPSFNIGFYVIYTAIIVICIYIATELLLVLYCRLKSRSSVSSSLDVALATARLLFLE